MATNIDQRIVEMQFDNAQFEKGVATSLQSLETLKKSLNLDSALTSISNIEKSFSKMNFDSVADSINSIAGHFTTLGRNVDKIIDNMVQSAISKLTSIGKSISVDQIGAGFSKYADQTKAVQTITNATGKSVEEVEVVLSKLQKYTDETSYDFTTMASTIGKFTSVGVELEKAELAMEGIANEAALSGAGKAEANRAMYNFAQSLSSGSVKLIDWKSIENANMATKEFKEELIKTAISLGTINKTSETTGSIMKQTKAATSKTAAQFKETEVNYKSFNETLSEGWLTSDVLITTLARYADSTQGVGEKAYIAAQKALTWTDAIEAIKDAVSSSWMQSFKYIFGDLNEAIDLWTNFCNAIIEVTDAIGSYRNEILQGWHEQGGYNDMIETASNLWTAFTNVLDLVRDAFNSVIPPATAENLVDITSKLKSASESLVKLFNYNGIVDVEEEVEELVNYASEFADNIEKGMSGDYVKLFQQALINAGYSLDKFGADGIYGSETRNAIKALQKDLGVSETGEWDEATRKAAILSGKFQAIEKATETVTKNIGETYEVEQQEVEKIVNLGHQLPQKLLQEGDIGDDVKDLQEALVKMGYLDEKLADGIYGPKTRAAVEQLQKDYNLTQESGLGVFDVDMRDQIISLELYTETVKEVGTATKTVGAQNSYMERLYNTMQGVAAAWSIVTNLFSLGAKVLSYVVSLFAPVADGFLTIASAVGTCLVSLNDFLNESGAYETWFNSIKTFLQPFATLLKGVGDSINNFFLQNKDIKTFTELWKALRTELSKSKIWKTILDYLDKFVAFVEKAKSVIIGLYGTAKKWISEKFTYLFTKGNDGVTNLQKGVTDMVNTVKTKFDELSKKYPIIKTLGEYFENAKKTIGDFVTSAKNKFSTFFDSMGNFNSEQFLEWVTEKFNSIKQSISTFVSESGKKFDTFKTKISDAFTAFKNKIEELRKKYPIIDNIANAFETLGTTISTVWGNIKDVFMKAFESGTFDKNTFFDTIKQKFEDLKTALDNTIKYIKIKFVKFQMSHTGFSKAFQTVKDVIQDIKNLFDALVETVKNFFNTDFSSKSTFAEKLQAAMDALQPIVDWFIGIKDKIVEAWDKLTNLGSGGGGGGGFFSLIGEAKKFFEGMKDFDWKSLILPAIGAVVGYSMIKNGGIFGNVSKALKNFSTTALLKSGGKQDDQFGTMMLKLAGAIAIVAFSIGLLSLADMNKVEQGILKMAEVLAIVIGFGLIAKTSGGKHFGKDLLMLSASVAAIAVGLGLMIAVVSSQGFKEHGAEAITLMVGCLVALGIVEIAISKFGGNAKGGMGFSSVLGMCAGLVLIALAIGALTLVVSANTGAAWQAFAMIEILLLTLGGIFTLISKNAPKGKNGKSTTAIKGFLSLAASLFILTLSISKLTKLIMKDGKATWQAFGMVEALLVTMGVIAYNISKNQISMKSAIAGLVVFVSLAGSISALAYVLGDVLLKIKDVDPHVMEVFFTALGVALAAMVGALLVLTKTDVGLDGLLNIIEGSAGLIVIATALGAAVEILALFAEAAISSIASGMETLGYAIEYFCNCLNKDGLDKMKTAKDILSDYAVLMKNTITGIDKTQIDNFGQGLKDIASNFQIAYNSIKDVKFDLFKKDGGFVVATKTVASLLKSAELQITEEQRNSIVNYCNAFQDLGAGMYDGYASLKDTNLKMLSNPEGDLYKAVHQISEMIKSDDIQGLNGITISGFINNLGDVSTTLSSYYGIIEKIKDLSSSKAAIELVKDVNSILSYAEVKLSFDRASQFETNLGKIGAAVSIYYGNIAGVNGDTHLSPEQIRTAFQAMVDAIPESDVIQTISNYASDGSKGAEITAFAGGIVNLGEAIKQYGESIGTLESAPVDKANSVIETVGNLQKNLSISQFLGFVSEYLGISDGTETDPMKQFSNNVIYLGNALGQYGTSIGSLETAPVSQANSVIETISGTYKELTTQSSWFGTVKTVNFNAAALFAFSRTVISLGNAVGKYISSTKDADPDKIKAANSVIETLASAYTTITDTSSFMDLLGYINGKKDAFGKFVTDVNALGNAMDTYAKAIGGLSIFKVMMANSIINTLANLDIPKTGGFIGWLNGYADLGKFGDQLGHVGKGIATFCNNLDGSAITKLSDGTINNAATLLTSIATAKDALETTAQKYATTPSLKNVGKEFVEFGESLNEFSTRVGSITGLNDIYLAKRVLDDIVTSLNSFSGIKGYSTVSSFLYDLGEGLFQYFSQLNAASTMQTTIDTWASNGNKVVSSFISGFQLAINEDSKQKIYSSVVILMYQGIKAIGDNTGSFKTNTEKLIQDGIVSVISTYKGTITSNFRTIMNSAVRAIQDYYDSFLNVGKYLSGGLASGIYLNGGSVSSMAKRVAWDAYNAACAELGVRSPSRKFAEIGRFVDLGFANGLNEYSGRVYDSASSVSDQAISGAQKGLSDFSSLVFDEMSDEPVIRPVLDLSEVQAGVAGMNGMFGTQTVGVRSAAIASSIAAGTMRNDMEYQQQANNNSGDIKSTLEQLNGRIDELGQRISNMQVVTETGALIGQITNGIDKALGKKAYMALRGV